MIIASGTAEDALEIERNLLASLRSQLPQSANESFTLVARDGGQLLGGLAASTSYGWLLVKTLWVDAASRGQGIGSALMQAAEERARTLGCHSVWLDTSNPQAKTFYANSGYGIFGQIENGEDYHPKGHARWFMSRRLASEDFL